MMTHSNSWGGAGRARGRWRTTMLQLAVSGVAVLLFTLAVMAGAQPDASSAREPSVPDVLTLAEEHPGPDVFRKGFASRHVGPVRFDHAAHERTARCADCHHEQRAHRMESMPSCGSCHHGPDALVTSNANMRCVECHSTRGLLRFSGTEGIERHDSGMSTRLHLNGEAFHELCIACHQQSNIAGASRWAPVACIACHSKTETTYEFVKD